MASVSDYTIPAAVSVATFVGPVEVQADLEPGPMPDDLPEALARALIDSGHATRTKE